MQLLGGMSPDQFLREHWQKRPLLVRQAIPNFAGLLDDDALLKLATRRDISARTVSPRGVEEGPFATKTLRPAPKNWTVLVQGVEQHIPTAWDLLLQFSFIPLSRIDDLMISYATPGGGVGPHVDRYDVFLLQGPGRRRWKIDATKKVPAGIVKTLRASDTWDLAPGDMLYLPPNVAHWGVALDTCQTYSIGFLAPTHEQLLHNFLGFLGQEVDARGAGGPAPALERIYEDPDLIVPRAPAEVGDDTVVRVERVLEQLRFDRERVATFLGRYLTGPKPGTVFRPSAHASQLRFDEGALMCAPATRMLFRGSRVFLNGDALAVSTTALAALANTRRLTLPAPGLTDDATARAIVSERVASGELLFIPARDAPRSESRPRRRRR